MLSMLVDDGLLEKARSGSTVDVADIPAPPSIQALLAARLDRLPRGERQVIERAAVQGKVFYRDALSDPTEEGGSALGANLLALIRKQLIGSARSDLAEQEVFRFVHGLVRDAAYQGIPKERRAALHEAFAGWLEGVVGDRVLEYEEILAYHLEQGYRYRAGNCPAGTLFETGRNREKPDHAACDAECPIVHRQHESLGFCRVAAQMRDGLDGGLSRARRIRQPAQTPTGTIMSATQGSQSRQPRESSGPIHVA